MASKLEERFQDSYNAYLLSLASERAKPGMLLDTDWSLLWWRSPEFRREEGWAWDFATSVDSSDYPVQEAKVTIVGHKISGKHSFAGDVSLPQYGVQVGAKFDREFATVITLTGVRALTFNSGKSKYGLREALRALPEDERKWVDDDLLISTSYYVSSFVADFRTEGSASAKAKFTELGQTLGDGQLSLSWKTDHSFVADVRPDVPLFVRGIKV